MSHFTRYRASVRNGSKSHGPLTAETKAASAKNATTHGLACPLHGVALRSAILANESIDNAQALLDRYLRTFDPATDLEMELVEELAVIRWRCLRAIAIETSLFDLETPTARETLGKEFEKFDEALVTGATFRELAQRDNAFALLNRYEGRLRAQYSRTLKNLREIQEARSPQVGPPASDTPPLQTQPVADKNIADPVEPSPSNAAPPLRASRAMPKRLKSMLAPVSVLRRFHERNPKKRTHHASRQPTPPIFPGARHRLAV